MTTQRRPPDKAQCMRSGAIFAKTQQASIEDKPYTTNVCPVCAYRTHAVYTPCRIFQDVDVDAT